MSFAGLVSKSAKKKLKVRRDTECTPEGTESGAALCDKIDMRISATLMNTIATVI